MNWLRKVSKLSAGDVWILLQAWGLVIAIRLGLWLLPFSILHRMVSKTLKPVSSQHPILDESEKIQKRNALWRCVWAVGVTSRLVPQATCLTQALASQILLRRRGYEAIVHLGVGKSETGQFQAHAWVESEGRIVIGNTPGNHWTPLTTLPES